MVSEDAVWTCLQSNWQTVPRSRNGKSFLCFFSFYGPSRSETNKGVPCRSSRGNLPLSKETKQHHRPFVLCFRRKQRKHANFSYVTSKCVNFLIYLNLHTIPKSAKKNLQVDRPCRSAATPTHRYYLVRTWVAELQWRHRPVSTCLFSRSWQWRAMTSRCAWWRHWPPAARTCWWWELHRTLHQHRHTHTFRPTTGQTVRFKVGMWRSLNSNSTTFELRTFSTDSKFVECFKRCVVDANSSKNTSLQLISYAQQEVDCCQRAQTNFSLKFSYQSLLNYSYWMCNIIFAQFCVTLY